MGIITSDFNLTLDGSKAFSIGEDQYKWEGKRINDVVDIASPDEGRFLTARLKLTGDHWGINVLRTGYEVNTVISDESNATSDDLDRAFISVIVLNGFGTNTVILKNADVETIIGFGGSEKITVGNWVTHLDLNRGNDHVSVVGVGAAGDINLGRGNDTLKTAGGHVVSVDAGRGSDTVTLGKGGADYINLDRDADVIKLSMLADKGQAVVLNGGEGVTEATDKDSDTVDFSAFSGKLTVDLNGQATVKSGHGNFYIRNFENAFGGSGKDVLVANTDANLLKGNGGADHFVFKAAKAAAGDTILDFSRSQKDKIDLGAMDASTKSGGDQDFTFIGTAGFHKKAGELRYEKKGGDTLVHGDVNGDGKADFSITIDASLSLKASDFIL